MKKTLRISLVALFAAVPMMAMAAVGDPVAGDPLAQGTQTDAQVTTTVTPKFAVATSATTDTNAASAGYVKGAYNAAIRAINTVHGEATAAAAAASAAAAAASAAQNTANNALTADSALNGANLTSGTVAKTALAEGVQSSLNRADSAFQSAGTGLAQSGTTVSLSEATQSSLAKADSALQSTSALNGANLTSGTVAKTALAEGVQSSLNRADSAFQSAGTGLAKDGTTVSLSEATQSALVKANSALQSGAKVSLLDNDAGYITKNVSDLTNYTTTTNMNTALNSKVDKSAIQSSLSSASTDDQVASAKAVYDATKNAATQAGVKATVNTATAAYEIMQTWGSDSATSATYAVSVASYVAQ